MLKMCQVFLLFSTLFSTTFADFYFPSDIGQNAITKQPVQPEIRDLNMLENFPFRIFSQDKSRLSRNNEIVETEVKDDALFLTPYIKGGKIKKAQELATVKLELKNVESFAGYLTVNKTTQSNMFFWLFKSQEGNWEERPLVIWLEGGPGSSSMLSLLMFLGPFSVGKDQKLVQREYSWNRKCNLVFFDNPVGTGFSFTKMDSGYARTEIDVARDLYEAIVQLYKLFPSLQKNQLFITGESYAGKYIPAIAYKIHKMNQGSEFKINLAGLMIGNGWTDPIHELGYASYLYELGMIDGQRRDKLALIEDEARKNIKVGKFTDALKNWNQEVGKIKELTSLMELHDILDDDTKELVFRIVQFLSDGKTKKSLHVGSMEFSLGRETNIHLANDFLQSVKPWLEELLTAEEFPIMFYNGQLDVVVAYPLGVEFYNSLKWPRAEEYHNANRCQLKVGGEVAGYYKTAGTFTEVLVRNAGHLVPLKQPKVAFELLDKFITNSSSFICN